MLRDADARCANWPRVIMGALFLRAGTQPAHSSRHRNLCIVLRRPERGLPLLLAARLPGTR